MSLQGTLETFALPDVLVLLASTKKTGELKVAGARGEGRLWVDKGEIVHAQTNGKGAAAVDTIFELLRLDAGTFAFETDATPPGKNEPEVVDLVLADAQGRLGEWRDIERVVPNLDAVVDMAAAAPHDEVTVTSAQWKLLVGVAGGREIHTVMARLERSEFDTCKAVKELVEAGFATIDTTGTAPKVAAGPAKAGEKAGEKADPKAEAGTAEPESATPAVDAKRAGDAKATDDTKPEGAKPESTKPAKAEATDEVDAADAAGAADDLVEQLGRARRVRTNTSSEGGARAPLPKIGANTNSTSAGTGTSNGKDEPEVSEADRNRDEDTEALVAQLAALGVDEDDPAAKEKIAARLAEESAASGGDEPINRGLLLKFLSSVRN